MSNSPVNLHRSFAGLLVGIILAIFMSGLVTIVVWQMAFPDFYAQLKNHLRDRKQADQALEEDNNPIKPEQKNDADRQPKENPSEQKEQVDEKKKQEDQDKTERGKEQTEPPRTPLPEFHLGVWLTTLAIDVVFAFLAGVCCVWICGFAHNNHGMLMALFIMVWKVQQLIGFVENQIPPSLIVAELVALPIACIVGASLIADGSNEAAEQDQGPEQEDEPS